MSKLVERLQNDLSSAKDGHSLVNVKFFRGSNRDITQEQLVNEATKAVSQMKFGQPTDLIDGDSHKITIEQFLK